MEPIVPSWSSVFMCIHNFFLCNMENESPLTNKTLHNIHYSFSSIPINDSYILFYIYSVKMLKYTVDACGSCQSNKVLWNIFGFVISVKLHKINIMKYASHTSEERNDWLMCMYQVPIVCIYHPTLAFFTFYLLVTSLFLIFCSHHNSWKWNDARHFMGEYVFPTLDCN